MGTEEEAFSFLEKDLLLLLPPLLHALSLVPWHRPTWLNLGEIMRRLSYLVASCGLSAMKGIDYYQLVTLVDIDELFFPQQQPQQQPQRQQQQGMDFSGLEVVLPLESE